MAIAMNFSSALKIANAKIKKLDGEKELSKFLISNFFQYFYKAAFYWFLQLIISFLWL